MIEIQHLLHVSLHFEEDLSEEVKKNNSVNLEDFQVLNDRMRDECN